jgi:hypothetical protein
MLVPLLVFTSSIGDGQSTGAREKLKYALVEAIITRMEQHLTLPSAQRCFPV